MNECKFFWFFFEDFCFVEYEIEFCDFVIFWKDLDEGKFVDGGGKIFDVKMVCIWFYGSGGGGGGDWLCGLYDVWGENVMDWGGKSRVDEDGWISEESDEWSDWRW